MFRWRRVHTSRSKITPTEAPSKASAPGIGPSAYPERDECCFSSLPHQLLETILNNLKDEMGRGNTKDMLSAIGVCKSWRAAGHAMFFKDSWGSGMQTPSGPAIQHPAQLITLCPLQHSPGGHVKCYMQRELVSNGLSGKVHRYVLRQGVDYAKANGKFLLAAVQEGKQSHSIFLDRSCTGKPIARISANVMRTTYTLLTAAGSGGSRNARTGRSSSPGDEKQQAAHGAEQQHVHDSQQQQQQQQQQPKWCGCALCNSSAAGGTAMAAAAPQELARVAYKLRVRGIMLPRRMSVSIPAPQQQQQVQQQLHQQAAAAPLKRRHAASGQDDLLVVAAAAAAEIQNDTAAQTDQRLPPAAALAARGFSRSSTALPGQQMQGLDLHAAAGRARCFSDGALPQGSWQQQEQQQHSPSFRTALQLQLQLLQQQRQRTQHCPLHFLQNKQPHWNDALRCWCLNFRGRVRLASVKNFQLVTDPDPPRSAAAALNSLMAAAAAAAAAANASFSSDGALSLSDASSSSSDSGHPASVAAAARDEGREAGQAGSSSLTTDLTPTQGLLLRGSANTGGVVTQFGKVAADVYILDYDPVLINGLQAFAAALTSFGTKVLL